MHLPEESMQQYPLQVDVSMYNPNGIFYPASIQRMAFSMISSHLKHLQMDNSKLTRQYGISWVMLSFSAEICRPLSLTETFEGRTWHVFAKPPICRRDFLISDSKGPVVKGATYSTMVHIETRRICTDRALLRKMELENGDPILQATHRAPALPVDSTDAGQRTVFPSWIDGVGHVNNLRYPEMAYDTLTREERLKVDCFRRMDVWFQHELTEGANCRLRKASAPDSILVCGQMPTGQPSFTMRLMLCGL